MQFSIKSIGKVKVSNEQYWLEIDNKYLLGLRHLEHFSHIIVLWWIDKRDTSRDRNTLIVKPPRLKTPVETGVFSSRSPSRPNPIGLTVVKIIAVRNNRIYIDRIDAFDETPVIDIKPYLPGDSIPLSEIKLPDWFSHLFSIG
ncbi:MAG: tRNA (N6-threonylcarbamoyladenosine(37)-N6)-methyltransferase TrmO [Candidatus Heimdallarchaeaceae archaeon]